MLHSPTDSLHIHAAAAAATPHGLALTPTLAGTDWQASRLNGLIQVLQPSPSPPHWFRAGPTNEPSFQRRLGVYVHFPYCLSKCPYCDFASQATGADGIDSVGYADAVLRELALRASSVPHHAVESLFFGGGTPSLWEPEELGRVIAALRSTLEVLGNSEVTVECNPSSLDEDRARRLVGVGVNRLSVGVQSLRPNHLRFLGRLHDGEGAHRALHAALNSGASRVSADLIFGLPGQSPEEAQEEALRLAALGVTHLSCYQLTVEAGTRFGDLERQGRLPLADEGAVVESYLAIDEALETRGFRHYEVSNYALPGHECRHNLGYWRGGEYLGLGCAAVGFVRTPDRTGADGGGLGVRWRNVASPPRYLGHSRKVGGAAEGQELEELDAETLLRERIMLGLRTDSGVDLTGAGNELGILAWTPDRLRAAAHLAANGRIDREQGFIRIPKRGWLWTDAIARDLI